MKIKKTEIKKIDLSNNPDTDFFYSLIYPIFAKEFLFECEHFEDFIILVTAKFIISEKQLSHISNHWMTKEELINNEN